MVFGCFLLIGTVMGLISILLIGPGRVAPARTALTLALSAAVGIGLVMMGTAVRRGSDAARWGSLACLVLLVSGSAVLVVAGVRQERRDGPGISSLARSSSSRCQSLASCSSSARSLV